MWSAHDETWQQHVRTAYGLTGGVKPRCGAFGQGAEEPPMGFVSLMCWKSDYLFDDEDSVAPYMYSVNET